ncbi:MAG TPA: fumarylacetoacetate hydrolase family protein [Sphingobium sp.]|nr:fumarylacetoacetate hydrolase family protein [Sphingobium sp.]
MRLVTFEQGGASRLGAILNGEDILDLATAVRLTGGSEPAFASMRSLIDEGERALDRARCLTASPPGEAVLAASTVRLLAPLPRPAQIRDFSAFEQHMLQSGKVVFAMNAIRAGKEPPKGPVILPQVWYDQPIYYKANRFAVGNPGDDVVWPAYSQVADYELEMAAVIGRTGRDIPVSKAKSHIFGYTIYNDFSARDAQGHEMTGPFGPAKGKDFDGSIILGPCIVTADEMPAPYQARMTATVNGELWSEGSMSSIHWRFEDMIAHVSASETIHPGEIFGAGTVGGGCGLEQARFLADGDLVELAIEGIGAIRNRVRGAQLRGGVQR